MERMLPRTWDDLTQKLSYMPVVVNTIEKIHDTKWSGAGHKHDHFEMVYIKKGQAVVSVDNIDVNMSTHSIIIIKPEKAHKFIVKSDSCEFIVLRFRFKTKKSEDMHHISLSDFIEYIEDETTGAYLHLKLGKKNDIFPVLAKILREKMKYQIWGDFLSCLLIMELFVLLSRTLKHQWEQSAKNRNLKLTEILNIAKTYIDNNFEKELTLSQVAKYIYLSDSYFAHSFKNKFGISPKSYILRVRIENAKELLENTDNKIADIALSVGFSSQQRFNDIFKKHLGVTPLRYRQNAKNEKVNKIEEM